VERGRGQRERNKSQAPKSCRGEVEGIYRERARRRTFQKETGLKRFAESAAEKMARQVRGGEE